VERHQTKLLRVLFLGLCIFLLFGTAGCTKFGGDYDPPNTLKLQLNETIINTPMANKSF